MPDVLKRRALFGGLLGGALAAPALAKAASLPVRLLVPGAPSTQIDILARALAEAMRGPLGETILVEPRPGANGIVAVEYMRHQPADGKTLIIAGGSVMIYSPALYTTPPYDPVRDFTSVGLIAHSPMMLVVSGRSGVGSFGDFLRQAKARPEGLSYASGGYGHATHIAMAMLSEKLGIRLTHVPYATQSPFPDLIAGNVDLLCGPVGSMMPLIPQRQLVPLVVLTEQRLPELPDLPTLREEGYEVPRMPGWYAVFGPAGMADDVAGTLNAAMQAALGDAGLKRWLDKAYLTLMPGDAARLTRTLRDDIALWQPFVRGLGISVG
jgi:tripartite-type tricarboxylate transporter receptor subunit TctC